MSAKEKAISLVDSYRIILMNEDTECGNEILCSVIAKKCALIALDEKLEVLNKISCVIVCHDLIDYYLEVKQEIEKL
jgi:hypothetical protein